MDGDIIVNGQQIGPYMRFLSGFMYQEDLFVPYLTAKEHLSIMVSTSFQHFRIMELALNTLILNLEPIS